MAKVKGLIIQEDLIAQEFDLESILGVDLSEADSIVSQIGNDIVEFIQKRAESGQGIGGKKLRSPYSKEYSESFDFKAYGKSPGDVNMTLTGDMLGAIDVLGFDGKVLTVGIEDSNAPKAHGHMTGMNGAVPKMKREFFGLTMNELKPILNNYKSDLKQLAPAPTRIEDLLTPAENAAVDNAFKNVGDLFNFDEGGDGL